MSNSINSDNSISNVKKQFLNDNIVDQCSKYLICSNIN